jgi:hypothetical protein
MEKQIFILDGTKTVMNTKSSAFLVTTKNGNKFVLGRDHSNETIFLTCGEILSYFSIQQEEESFISFRRQEKNNGRSITPRSPKPPGKGVD